MSHTHHRHTSRHFSHRAAGGASLRAVLAASGTVARSLSARCALALSLLSMAALAVAGCAPSGSHTFVMDELVLASGEEALRCQTFANPWGQDVQVKSWSSLTGETGHHLLVAVLDDAVDGALGSCGDDSADDAVLVYGAQTAGENELVYPAGTAVSLPAHGGLKVQVHAVNATLAEAHVNNTLTIELAEPGPVAPVSPFRFDNFDIEIPPTGAPVVVERTCTLDRDVDVLWLSSHMHARGRSFAATVTPAGDGAAAAPLYAHDEGGEAPTVVFDPPRRLHEGDAVTFACTYVNNTADTIRFGVSLASDEMCNLGGAWVPVGSTLGGMLRCEGLDLEGSCLSCAAALEKNAPDAACGAAADDDGGAASAREQIDALKQCTCAADGCAAECADSSCGDAGGVPSDGCFLCISSKCAGELASCLAG